VIQSDHVALGSSLRAVRAALFAFVLLVAASLVGSSPAAAAGCPTQTFLSFSHRAYVGVSALPTVPLGSGATLGTGTLDHPISADGCKRAQNSGAVLMAGSIDPRVAVLVHGRPRTVFVIGHRCDGFQGTSYWACLLEPLVFDGRQFTASSYPSEPVPRKTLPLGAAIGTAGYHGRTVTVRRIVGVDPSLAVGISGQPSVAFLSPPTCPYSGFSNISQYDNLLRCLRSPVWFTFDPPGSDTGGTVVARADRPLTPALAGSSISLVQLSVEADFVPPHHGPLVALGRVADQVSLKVPNVSPGLYEAVISCPGCGRGAGSGGTLYPAGSILVTAKPKTSLGITIISYALVIALVVALIVAFRTRRRRVVFAQGVGAMVTLLGKMLMGPGAAGSSRRERSWSEDASAPPPARGGQGPAASPPATRAARDGRGAPRGKNAGRRGRKRRGG
jgi:hypothetical protein